MKIYRCCEEKFSPRNKKVLNHLSFYLITIYLSKKILKTCIYTQFLMENSHITHGSNQTETS